MPFCNNMLSGYRFSKQVHGLCPAISRYSAHCQPNVSPLSSARISLAVHRPITSSKPFRSPQDEDSEHFWTVSASDTNFWESYVATRPKYSKSFYNLMYDHHSAHSASRALAHDVGCGAGQVAALLTTNFTHVVASDIVGAHLDVAKARLVSEIDPSRVSFTLSKGEDLALHHPAGSADMIAAAEAVVLMDTAAGLRSFATVLKPGGTLACWFYGRPTFAEAMYRERGQRLLDSIMVASWRKVIQGSGEKRLWGFKRCADQMASWLDYMHFPADTWTDVKRFKWNTRHGTLPFFGEEACGFEVRPASSVSEQETCLVEEEDPNFWRNEWDVQALRKYFEVLFPGFREKIAQGDEEIEGLFEQLARAMEGEGKVRSFTWPCVLVLATRK